jgi:hypothetical protein
VYGYSLVGQYVATAAVTTRRRMISNVFTLLKRRGSRGGYVT